ncbi:7017_t:CDS:2, partial [Cetraspora pellucida]
MDCFTDVILISDDELEIIDTSTLEVLQTFNIDDGWNTDITDELQKLNNQ